MCYIDPMPGETEPVLVPFLTFLTERDALVRASFENFSEWEGMIHEECGAIFTPIRVDANFPFEPENGYSPYLNVGGIICMGCSCVEKDEKGSKTPRVSLHPNDLEGIRKAYEKERGLPSTQLRQPFFDSIEPLSERELALLRKLSTQPKARYALQ